MIIGSYDHMIICSGLPGCISLSAKHMQSPCHSNCYCTSTALCHGGQQLPAAIGRVEALSRGQYVIAIVTGAMEKNTFW